MPNLSIKDVPEALAEALRQRAARNHRSLQGELMALVEAAVGQSVAPAPAAVAALAPMAREPAAPAYLLAAAAQPSGGDLLAELDAIVAGSQWGSGGLLTREQANDRRLAREFEYAAMQQEAGKT